MTGTIVAFGDSTTAPRGALKVYADHLRERFPGWTVINAGVGADTTDLARARFDREVLAHKPDWVIIQFGLNDACVDVWKDPPPNGPRTERGRYIDNLRFFVREIRKAGGRPILLTPNRMCWNGPEIVKAFGKPPYRPDREEGLAYLVKPYAEAVRRLANEEGVPLADIYALYEAHAAKPGPGIKEWLLDFEHPNDKGQALVADQVEPILRSVIDFQDKPTVDKGPLPDLFKMADGKPVRTPTDWPARRQEMLDLVQEHEYGPIPPAPAVSRAIPLHPHQMKLYGSAQHRGYKLEFGANREVSWVLDVLIPNRRGPFPAVLCGDGCWGGYLSDRIVEETLNRGYILARFNRCECYPDIYGAPRPPMLEALFPGLSCSALAAWAWAYHRSLDALLELPEVDPARVGVFGHSRGGKASLLAGATDTRVALTGSNGSGCGGAGCFRHLGPASERLADIVNAVPYWFAPTLKAFINREAELPVDQHMVKALVAPRALFTSEALDDLWANPRGTWHTHAAAREAYRLLGAEEKIGIHFRPGEHVFCPLDWEAFLDFADWQFKGLKTERRFDLNPFDTSSNRKQI